MLGVPRLRFRRAARASVVTLTLVATPLVACAGVAGPQAAPTAGEAHKRAEIGSETAEATVARARHALGWDELARSSSAMRITGAAHFLGTDATQTMLFDGRGRYLQSFDGPMGQSSGTDGKTDWARDWSGTARVLVLGDRAQGELERMFATGAWTTAGDRLAFEGAARRDGDDLVLDFAHADRVVTGTIRLDPGTLFPRAVSYSSGTTPFRWTYGVFADSGGFAFPARVEYEQGGRVQSFQTGTVERLQKVDATAFAPRTGAPRDARFDPKIPPALEVKVARSGHVLVHPLVDGKDLGWFIFDTGAGTNCIANDVTGQLGTEPFGEIAALGVGGRVAAQFWHAKELRLGPVTVDAPVFIGLDLAFLEQPFGVRVGGILGYEFLSRCVAELDMQAGSIALHDPACYALPEPGRWEELIVYNRHPCVRARFEDHEGVFNIDTGAAGDTVTFHYQAVADLELVAGRETRASQAGGVGGSVATKVGKLASFRLGGRDLGAIEASFAQEDKGAFADDYVAGNIGGKLLQPFRMVFDYPGNRVGFVPR
jgi:hypothetical protein